MANIQCPACGELNVTIDVEKRIYQPPFGAAVEYFAEVATCLTCEERGDFREVNTRAFEEAEARGDKQSLETMLESLAEEGYSMAHIERVLGLPQRTLARWKDGSCSAGGLALLRFVRTFPWLLKVAESRFDPETARKALRQAERAAMLKEPEATELLLAPTAPTVRVAADTAPSNSADVSFAPSGNKGQWVRSPAVAA